MSLGGNRNGPGAWNRQGAPQNQQLNPNLFAQQINLAQPFGAQLPQINALVNQAAFGGVNLAAAQRQMMPQRQASPPAGGNQRTPNQRTFVGQITKLMDNYGFIDEDVFFQTSVIKGQIPRIGDRVMVEATFNPSMPFKWNAFRIQAINEMNAAPQQQYQQPIRQPANQQQSGGNRWNDRNDRGSRDDIRGPRGTSYERNRPQRRQSPLPRRDDRRSPIARRSPPRRASPPPRRQSPIRREPPKRERERSPIIRESREPRRSPAPPAKRDVDSPPRRRQRIIPRYQCFIPRPLVPDFLNYTDLHKRYGALYIPSDFVRCDLSWKSSFNLEDSITFSPNAVNFHVLHKDVDYPFSETSPLPVELPDDADSRYVVKVLLLTHPGATDIRKKVTGLLTDGSIDETLDVQNLFKVLHFVIGNRAKGECMGIGGPWSPSLDGENPLDPQTLINTAVRTTRAMTGVDLSKCPTWYKMLHLRYFRVERDRWDHVLLLLPDTGAIPNFLPTAEDYQKLIQEVLPEQLKQKISQIDAEPFVPQSEAAKKVQAANESKPTEPIADDSTAAKTTEEATKENADSTADSANALDQSTEQVENSEANENGNGDVNKTHWSQLQVKSLKVAELREQLDARGLDSKGVKNVLAQRLQEAVDAEKASEENGGEGDAEKPLDDIVMTDEVSAEPEISDLVVTDEVDEKMDTAEADQETENKVDEEQSKAEEKTEEQPKVEEKPAYTKEEKEEHKKELDRFEKSKKDRKSALERHFVFPKEPAVLIYPNKTAKSGKFDCRSVSVQSLLDYRIDDNKESSFEVFLFAEAFHEAIDRGFAFDVYNSLNSVYDKESERKRRDEALTKVETPIEAEETKAADEIEVKEEAKPAEENKPAEDDDDIIIIEDDKPAAVNGETKKEEKKESKKEKSVVKDEKIDARSNFKALVNDVNTFMAFCHFDQNICGYLADRDVEEILHSIGLNISRATAQRLIRKVSSRDRFNYRNITDQWVDKEFNVKYVPEPLPDAPTRAQLLKLGEEEFPTATSAPATGSTPDVTNTGTVLYKGTVLNIAQAQEQHKLVENERSEALLKVQQLEQQLKIVKDQRDHSDKKHARLEEKVENNRKKLEEAEKSLKAAQESTKSAIDIIATQVGETNSA